MRVISGTAKGHKLLAPEGLRTRPTTDKVKESLFNILAPELMGARVLDLFSGSGAIGIEALSRGAKSAYFVDSAFSSKKIIERNLNFTKLQERAKVLKSDCVAAIFFLGEQKEQFDLIFMDPPYEENFYTPVFEAIVKMELLAAGGLFVAEHASKIPLPEIAGLKIIREKDYKTTTMSFLISGE